ncbi:unnamed protein product [Danaus chrysippus]|uniref:(African queen) hypothetical protein n=1 Tax=Danaus chrysippus TaxID=151541 RepID=A0A8J2R2U0_9NEOP|nr:unnamed protein product [Danaus chrysippus]
MEMCGSRRLEQNREVEDICTECREAGPATISVDPTRVNRDTRPSCGTDRCVELCVSIPCRVLRLLEERFCSTRPPPPPTPSKNRFLIIFYNPGGGLYLCSLNDLESITAFILDRAHHPPPTTLHCTPPSCSQRVHVHLPPRLTPQPATTQTPQASCER